jgi:hypothetical protein
VRYNILTNPTSQGNNMKNSYVRIYVWFISEARMVETAEEPLEKAFRADGVTFAGSLGKVYREYVANPKYRIDIRHLKK